MAIINLKLPLILLIKNWDYSETIDFFKTENFEDETVEPPVSTRKSSTVVAPATRSTSSKKITLKTSELNIAKKLGYSSEDSIKTRKYNILKLILLENLP